jgi:hypothetical protein
LHSEVPPNTLRDTARRQILSVNSNSLISGMRPMEEVLSDSVSRYLREPHYITMDMGIGKTWSVMFIAVQQRML